MPHLGFILRILLGAVIVGACACGVRAAIIKLRADPAVNAAPVEHDGADELAAILEQIRAQHNLPALAGAIILKGRVTAIGAVGVRRTGGEECVTVNDLFHIGSCTKAMTATLIAMLVEDGVLTWQTTIGEVFDNVPMDDAWRSITIEQLLHNRGGAPAGLSDDGLWSRLWAFDGHARESRMMLVRGVLSRPPGAAGQYVYSNAGYAMAGAMAERMIDTPWEEMMHERIFTPLGMSSAGFGPPGEVNRDGHADQPRGHRPNGIPVEPVRMADNPDAIAPAGKVHCSLVDWAKFIALHLGHNTDGKKLLCSETIARLHAPAEGPGESYAMGWIVTSRSWSKGEDDDEGTVLTHAGSNTLWYAVAWLAPERDLAVVIATNHGGDRAAQACDDAAGALVRFALSSDGQE